MDFLQGTALGAGLGAGVGGAIPAAGEAVASTRESINIYGGEAGAINPTPKPSDQFSQNDLQDMAKNETPSQIEKKLEPVTGPVVANQIAPAIAKPLDAHTAARIIDNDSLMRN